MSETKSTDVRLREAVTDLREKLIDRGMLPDAAQETAEGARGRILVSESGTVRVMTRGGSLYPVNVRDAFSDLVSELFGGAPAEAKPGASLQDRDPEAFEELMQQKRSSGMYG